MHPPTLRHTLFLSQKHTRIFFIRYMHPNRVQTPSHPPTLSLSITNTHSLSSFFIGGEQKKYLEKHLSPAFIGGGQNSSAACDGGQSFRVSVFFFSVMGDKILVQHVIAGGDRLVQTCHLIIHTMSHHHTYYVTSSGLSKQKRTPCVMM